MSEVTWTITAESRGYFVLGRQQETGLAFGVHPALRRLSLTPELNEHGAEGGQFQLELDFVVEGMEDDRGAANLGRNVLAAVLDLLTFSTGYPCTLAKDPHIRRPLTENGAYREHVFPQRLALGPFGPEPSGHPQSLMRPSWVWRSRMSRA